MSQSKIAKKRRCTACWPPHDLVCTAKELKEHAAQAAQGGK